MADVVVLNSGATMTGEVRVSKDVVRIDSRDGVTKLSRSLVRRVIKGDDAQPPPERVSQQPEEQPQRQETPAEPPAELAAHEDRETPPQEQTAREPAATDAEVQQQRASEVEQGTVPSPGEVLASTISVHFDDVSLQDAIVYVQEVTGGNFSYKESDLEAAPEPVTLHLDDVTTRQVLNVLMERADLTWYVREDIVRIRAGVPSSVLSVRVYDVGDLLYSREDYPARRPMRLDSDQDRGQFESDYRRDYDSGSDYEDRGSRGRRVGHRSESGVDRAYSLGMLITSTVRPESWQQPAVVVVGGRDRRRTETEERILEPW